MRELTVTDQQTHIYDDGARGLIMIEPGLLRIHCKLCGGVTLLQPLELMDATPLQALYPPCVCGPTVTSGAYVERSSHARQLYADLSHMIRCHCKTVAEVQGLLQRLAEAEA